MKRRILALVFLLALSTPLALDLLNPAIANAAEGVVIDRSHIKIGNQLYFDRDIDDTFDYQEQSPTDRCADVIRNFDNDELRGTNTPASATYVKRTPRPNNTEDCDEQEEVINFGSSRSNFLKAFVWIDANTIKGADGNQVYVRDSVNTSIFNNQNSEDRCVDTLTVIDGLTTISLQEREFEEDGDHEFDWFPFSISSRTKNDSSGCWESQRVTNIQIGGSPTEGNPADDPNLEDQPGTIQDNQNSCETLSGPLGWIICPVINTLDGSLNWLDTQIQRLLDIDRNKYRDEDLRKAWAQIRNIAYIVLVPIMLVMVIGTALGFGFLDAYTIRRAMPRFVIAVIFIALSWEITGFIIEVFNAVGKGILGLMTAPFGISGGMNLSTLFNINNAGGVVVQWAGASTVLLSLVALITIPGGAAIILSLLAVGAASLLIAFFVLVMRQVFIIALILLAPVAILAWIFPGNDRLWKLWWGAFSKLLLMFPLIMGIIAAGRIFAHIIGTSDSSGLESGVLNPLLKLIAYVAPYIFIPFTFKLAGGVFATITGTINDRSRGFFDRQKKKRQEGWGALGQRGGRNELFNKDRARTATGIRGRWMRGVNKVGGWVTEPGANLQVAMGTQRGKEILADVGAGQFNDTQKAAEVLSNLKINDRAAKALAVGVNGIQYDGTYQSIERMAAELEKSDNRNDHWGAQWLRQNGAVLTSAFRGDEFARANIHGAGALAYAAQGFISPEEITEISNRFADPNSTQYNPQLAVNLNSAMQIAAARGAGTRPGYSSIYDMDKKEFVSGHAPENLEVAMELAARTDTTAIGSMKGGEFEKNLAPAFEAILNSEKRTVMKDGKEVQQLVYTNADGTQTVADLDHNTIDSARTTLLQAYSTYTSADVRNRIKAVLTRAAEKQGPEAVERLNKELERYRGPRPEEMGTGEGEPGERAG